MEADEPTPVPPRRLSTVEIQAIQQKLKRLVAKIMENISPLTVDMEYRIFINSLYQGVDTTESFWTIEIHEYAEEIVGGIHDGGVMPLGFDVDVSAVAGLLQPQVEPDGERADCVDITFNCDGCGGCSYIFIGGMYEGISVHIQIDTGGPDDMTEHTGEIDDPEFVKYVIEDDDTAVEES